MTVLTQEDTASPAANQLNGLIAGQTFLGSVSRLSVLVGDYYLSADVPTGSQQRFHPGQVVQLSFSPDHCRVIPTNPERQTSGVALPQDKR
jgi:putative spermidine/putrescine transport system ATP-binding protein